MLTKLLERFDPEQFRVRESPLEPFEHDDEHEDDLVAATPLCASVVNPLFSAPSRLGSFFRNGLRRYLLRYLKPAVFDGHDQPGFRRVSMGIK